LGVWPIYCAGEPDSPDEVITVYDTSDRSDGRSMITGETCYHRGVQLRVRARDHLAGRVRAESLRHFLDEGIYRNGVTVPDLVGTGSHSYCVHCVSNTMILTLGKEIPASKRSLFTVNATVVLRALD
jgi:hypothetical protein